MDPREPIESGAQIADQGEQHPLRRARVSLSSRVLLLLVALLLAILFVLLVFTDTFIDRMSDRFAEDTREIGEQIAHTAGRVIEEQSQSSYATQAREQAQVMDLLFAHVEAGVNEAAQRAGEVRVGQTGVEALPASAFADPSRRPADQEFDETRGMEISWGHPAWHAAPDADSSAVRRDVARYENLRDTLVAASRGHSHVLWTYLGLPSGTLMLVPGNASFADEPSYDPTRRDWYRAAAEEGGTGVVWGLPYLDAATGRLTMSCSRAFLDERERLGGVIGFDLSLTVLQEWLEPLAADEDFRAYLVATDGRVVYERSYSRREGDWQEAFEPTPFLDQRGSDALVLLEDIAGGRAGVRRVSRPEGTRYFAHAPIPTVGWSLVLSYPNAALVSLQEQSRDEIGEVFGTAQATTSRRIRSLRTWFMVSVVGVCAVLMLAVAATLSLRFKRPVNRIIEDIEVVSTGDLDHQIRHESDDELGELAGAFNEMTLQLKRTRDQLRQYSRTLELRVAERTAELAQRNQELADLYEEAEQSYMQLKATQAQLVQHERMATLGQLVAGIAHEINNPVNFLINSVRPLRQVTAKIENVLRLYESAETLDTDEMADRIRKIRLYKKQMAFDAVLDDVNSALELIANGAERTSQIVENLRIFSRSEPTVYKPVDLRRGLDITLSLLAHQLRNRITVHKEYRKVPNVECNPSQINQVFMNLLGNAAQAIEGEGDIWLQVKPAGKYVRVRIRDNGCGIAEEHLYRIFEPFFTTKSEAHGTGLGLSITHNIIQDHGGTIEVRSEPGKGTEFTVSLPTTQGSSSQSLSGDTLSETPGSTQQIPIYQRSEHPRVVGMGEVPVEGDTGRYPQENTLDEERSNDTVDFGSQSDELRDPEPGGSFKKTAEMPTFPRGTRPEEDGSDEGDDPE